MSYNNQEYIRRINQKSRKAFKVISVSDAKKRNLAILNTAKFIEKNNKRLKDNHDIFWKIFSHKNSRILDCTGGFGRDGFLLNSMGHDVTIIENSPVVAMILKNALWRCGNKGIKFFFVCFRY